MIDAHYRSRRAPPTVLQPAAGTEPDLDLIKQVEQVTRLVWKGPVRRFAGIPSVGITDAIEVLVFLILQLVLRFTRFIHRDAPGSRLPGEGRDPCVAWAPAFAGVAEIWCQPWSALAE
jgi:hypothetical protein